MNAPRITLAAALALSLAACAGSPTAPARDTPRRRLDAAADTTRPPATTSTQPTDPPPPPGDGKTPILGSGG
ncbi:MAG TPA: hypothetical protein VFJ82_21300 [Longimicrobium sp.]|nr:hypothetical protein [Longimicrobium sp.]